MSRFTRSVGPGSRGQGFLARERSFVASLSCCLAFSRASHFSLSLPIRSSSSPTSSLDSPCFRRHLGPRTAQFGEFSRKKGSKQCLPVVVRIAWTRDLAHRAVSPIPEVKFVACEIGYSRIAEAFDCCVAGEREGLGKIVVK